MHIKVGTEVCQVSSGLKVNFWESYLMGVNVQSPCISMAAAFLQCKIGTVPFKYMGVVQANLRCLSTW